MTDTRSNVKMALSTMYSNSDRETKLQATKFLETFQKSQEAWTVAHDILNDDSETVEVRLFGAQTWRSKITYDLGQIPESSLFQLKDSVLLTLLKYNDPSMKIIRTQMCVSLSQLALQFLQWDNTLQEITTKLSGDENIYCLLDFLKIMPEELSDVKKSSLTDDEFNQRTKKLIVDNVEQVLMVLNNLATSSNNINLNASILDCLNSWIKECPVESVLTIQLLTSLIFLSLTEDTTFEKSVECLCTILNETKDLDNYELINALYEQILNLRNFLSENKEDPEILSGLTRIYVEAGEAWHVLVAKNPEHFKPLVEVLLFCCEINSDLDVVRFTFTFWYLLKQLISLPKFESSKAQFTEIYSRLIEVIIKHLTYPLDVSNPDDLFDGDKEQEDKFKEFRYEMGDVLKDCCVVVGATKALNIPFQHIQSLLAKNNGTTEPQIQWQVLEASLFSMRTMAKEVPLTEKTILPTIMTFLVQLPEHPKIRYAATLVLGRYTEWTAKNPSFLEPQLNYIIKGFEGNSTNKQNNDILVAASHALMYFCQDCSKLLVNYLEQLYMLYNQVKDTIDMESVYELADGLAHVIKQLPELDLYRAIGTFCDPTLQALGNAALSGNAINDTTCKTIADQLEIISTFVSVLRARDFDKPNYPICDYFMKDVWPVITSLFVKYNQLLPVAERILKTLKCAVQSFGTYLSPILPEIANLLHSGFQQFQYGCFLWVSGVVIREFGDESSSDEIKQSVFDFALSQSALFFKIIEDADSQKLKQMPDVFEDFFRMLNDLLMFFPYQTIMNFDFMKSCWNASILALSTLEQYESLLAVLHFLVDFVSWGLPHPPITFFDENPVQIKESVQQFVCLDNNGGHLIKVVMEGVIFKFHSDLLQDANDLILKILIITPDPQTSISWIKEVAQSFPNVSGKEIEKLVNTVSVALPNKDNRRIRTSIKDFVQWYSRKNVTPRSEF